jgi:hypothetical protein
MVRACEQGPVVNNARGKGVLLWLWGSERRGRTGARDGSAYGGSLTNLTEAVEFESRDDEKIVRVFALER